MARCFSILIGVWCGVFITSLPAYSQPEGMVLVPAGEFAFGLPEKSKPKIVSAFYIDRYEVTQKSYQDVMNENLSFFKSENRPVENVTWGSATDYCEKIGKRLPTEWEWEKAAKAGTDTLYHWGDAMDDGYAWHKGNSDKQTHPVGLKKPNSFGLYDMAGNVWEWTSSQHEASGRVLRGGSWRNSAISLRSGHRIYSVKIFSYHYVGFRCAKTAPAE